MMEMNRTVMIYLIEPRGFEWINRFSNFQHARRALTHALSVSFELRCNVFKVFQKDNKYLVLV